MEDYKHRFVEFLLQTGALKVFDDPKDDKTLKSKRVSPWFVNIGDFNDGTSSSALAGFYADAIIDSGVHTDVLYGIPDKGVWLAAPVAMAMAQRGHNAGWFFSRKDEKKHGEASNLPPEERIKALTVGRIPKPDESIGQLDDVFTAGDAKYEANRLLTGMGRNNLPLLAIALDRQEVAVDSREAIAEYQERTGTRVVSVVNAVDVYTILKEHNLIPQRALERLANYMRVYGTKAARTVVGGNLEQRIIRMQRSVIVAADVDTLEEFEKLVSQTADVEGIGGYKVGFDLGLGYSLPTVVETARKHTTKPIIYDHQKAGTDIPDTGRSYMRRMKSSGVDAVILFPHAGPETERAWIYEALDNDLQVIVGGWMTHSGFTVSEGGFITDEGALEMYRIAARAGINNFVVPGTKPDAIAKIKETVEQEGVSPVCWAPGFIAQGGSIASAAKVAGERFHGIVGRGIYKAKDMRSAAIEHTSQL